MNSMIWQNWDPFKKNKREALIKKMVLKRLGDEIRPISYQKFVFSMNLWFSAIIFRKPRGTKLQEIILGKIRIGGIEHFKKLQNSEKNIAGKPRLKKKNYPGEGSHHICIYRHRYILKMSMYSAVVFINVLAGGWNHADGIRNWWLTSLVGLLATV